MSLNNIVFILGQGGLGRPLPGEDFISGMSFYTATLPSGFTTTNRVKQVFSVAEAEALGIKSDYSDATAATSTNTVTAAGTDGDIITVQVTEPTGVVTLATYTKASTEATADAVAVAIAALINAGTVNHGYTAAADSTPAGELIITAPKKLGIYLNTKSPAFVENPTSSTFAVTIAAFTGGVASAQAIYHYHISEFFRRQPKGNLYLGFFAVPGGAYDFAEIGTMQNFAMGKIRQHGVFKNSAAAFSTADITAFNTALTAQGELHKEIMGVYCADISGTANLTALADCAALTAPYVVPCIGQDGAALGAFLYATTGKTVGTLGATLGALSYASVAEDIAWVEKFNMSNGTELDVPAFGNGQLVRDLSEGLLGNIQDKAYNFLRTFVGVPGSYFNEDRTAVTVQSDYAYASNVRTIQKARRGVYTGLIPALNSPITLNADGTLTDVSIEYLTTLAEKNMFQMQRDSEISAFEVVISSVQNVLSTGKIVVSVNIVPVGVARNIVVNIGFNVSIQ
jgi:hypothetical protein